MHCCIPTLTIDSNTSTGMIWVTLNMPSAAEECRRLSGNFRSSREWSHWLLLSWSDSRGLCLSTVVALWSTLTVWKSSTFWAPPQVLSLHHSFISGWPLVWRTWKCQGIWQLSEKCQGFYWKSGNCQGKNLVREKKLPKTAYLCPYRCLAGVCCVLNVKYMVLDHAVLHSYPHHWQ